MLVDFLFIFFIPYPKKTAINTVSVPTENHVPHFRNMKIDSDIPCYTRRYERKGLEPL